MAIIREQINHVQPDNSEYLAYRVDHVKSRLAHIESLSPAEKLRLVQTDELTGLVALLAELANLRLFPYAQAMVEGKLGSLISIDGDDGENIEVFRAATDMLYARTLNRPDNVRSRLVWQSYVDLVEPCLQSMDSSRSLVLVSPPDLEGEIEFEYGFAYVYNKLEDGVLEAFALRLDKNFQGYQALWDGNITNHIGGEMFLNSVFLLDGGETIDRFDRFLSPVKNGGNIGLGGEKVSNLSTWLKQQETQYQKLTEWVARQSETDLFLKALAEGDRNLAEKLLTQMQSKLVWEWRQDLVDKYDLMNQLSLVRIVLPCGVMYLNGFGSEENLARMGLGVGGECTAKKCSDCGCTEIPDEATECPKCGWAPGRPHRRKEK